jgi:hypothetical protein
LIAVGALASPASAHKATIEGRADCDTSSGQYIVRWTVSNDFGTTATRGRVNVLPEGSSVDLERYIPPRGSIEGVQRVPGNATSAGIELDRVIWERDDYVQDSGLRKQISLPGNCGAPPPPVEPPTKPPAPNPDCVAAENAEFSHTFNGAAGTATVKLDGDKPVCKGGDQDFALISYTASKVPGAQLKKFDADTDIITPRKSAIDLKVKLPPCYTKVYLVWGKKIIDPLTSAGEKYGDAILGSIGKPGNGSKGPIGLYDGGTAECATKPSVKFENTCTNVTITLINDGTLPATFVGASKVGDAPYTPFSKPATVDGGKRATLGVDAMAGLSVKVTSGSFSQEHTWTGPEECTTPSPSDDEETPTPTPGAGGGLPVTGAGLGGLIAAAFAATGLGTALVVLARRRRRAV